MPEITSVPETISELAKLVQSGDIPEARRLTGRMLDVAQTRELWVISRIADLFANRPRTAVDILRHWWKSAPTEADRAIIAACVPTNGEQRRHQTPDTDRKPHWNAGNKYQAPSTVTVTRQRPTDFRDRRRARQQAADDAAAARYLNERGGVTEGAQVPDREAAAQAEQVYASGFDYDRAALYGTETPYRCLSCTIERSRSDLDRERIDAGHGDDGLCEECRDSGRPGIPELPPGHTSAEAVTARCDYICEHAVNPVAARVTLLSEYRRAPSTAAAIVIADYGRAHFPPKQDAQPAPASAELAGCTGCPAPRTVRDTRGISEDDGLCLGCREELGECPKCYRGRTGHDVTADESDDGLCKACRKDLGRCYVCSSARTGHDVPTTEPDDDWCRSCRETDRESTQDQASEAAANAA